MNYSDRYTAAEISKEHFRLALRFAERADTINRRKRTDKEKIRVGYLAADFYMHPVGKLMLPILEAHDRDCFHLSVYHDGDHEDATTQLTRQTVDPTNR
ncbi:hypothetical protein CA13_37160 [Planctomycetes bacterium CA13]|uniref:O-GlcNAc transferase C-terminal domain-containing protein n=1 Tax=Novipirellula herctigrandis TaxID=2527986 RepID=A0A5C5Z4T2_9BACT|nr:hypothetical protein CA13_37160 [Planctomycetes bacterium CA13]